VSFLDLTGYTRLTEERGDQAAAEVAARLARLVRRVAQNHGGAPVKWLGDGVMCYFPDPAADVLAALEMVEAAAGQGLPPAHVGTHAGPVVFQDGDYFGMRSSTPPTTPRWPSPRSAPSSSRASPGPCGCPTAHRHR
jgi:adenylate cyclase